MNKKTKDLTMNDEFELRGYWWVPNNPDNKIAGILNYDSKRINLHLLGYLNEQEDLSKTPKYDVLLGITDKGEYITLCDGFRTKLNFSNNVQTQSCTFNKLIIGKHFNSIEEIKFHSLSISYSLLEEWMRFRPFDETTELENNKLKRAVISYEHPPIFEAYIKDKKTTIRTGYTFYSSSDYKKPKYVHKSTIDVFPDEQMNLEWFFNMTHEIQDFLTLLTNRAIYPKSLKAKGNITNEKHQIRESFTIFSLLPKTYQEKEIKPFEMFIDFQMIKDDWDSILNAWFTDASYSSRKIYLRNLYETERTWETIYLDYAKTLESFHRDTAGELGKFLSDELYEPIKNKMIEAIQQGKLNTDTFNNLRNKLSSTLKYAHHFGFERRVRDTLKGLDERIKSLIFPNGISQLKTFAVNTTVTRDYYTHYGEKPAYYFKDFDLYFVNHKLQITLFYYFCKKINIKEDIIFKVINEDPHLVNYLKMETEQRINQKADS